MVKISEDLEKRLEKLKTIRKVLYFKIKSALTLLDKLLDVQEETDISLHSEIYDAWNRLREHFETSPRREGQSYFELLSLIEGTKESLVREKRIENKL